MDEVRGRSDRKDPSEGSFGERGLNTRVPDEDPLWVGPLRRTTVVQSII